MNSDTPLNDTLITMVKEQERRISMLEQQNAKQNELIESIYKYKEDEGKRSGTLLGSFKSYLWGKKDDNIGSNESKSDNNDGVEDEKEKSKVKTAKHKKSQKQEGGSSSNKKAPDEQRSVSSMKTDDSKPSADAVVILNNTNTVNNVNTNVAPNSRNNYFGFFNSSKPKILAIAASENTKSFWSNCIQDFSDYLVPKGVSVLDAKYLGSEKADFILYVEITDVLERVLDVRVENLIKGLIKNHNNSNVGLVYAYCTDSKNIKFDYYQKGKFICPAAKCVLGLPFDVSSGIRNIQDINSVKEVKNILTFLLK